MIKLLLFAANDADGGAETAEEDEEEVDNVLDEDINDGDEDTFDNVAPAPGPVAGVVVEPGGPMVLPLGLAEGPAKPLPLLLEVPEADEVLPPGTVAAVPPPLPVMVVELLFNGFLPVEAGSIDRIKCKDVAGDDEQVVKYTSNDGFYTTAGTRYGQTGRRETQGDSHTPGEKFMTRCSV